MRDVMPPSLKVTGPGVYPLKTRECPTCKGRGEHQNKLVGPCEWVRCTRCHGTGRIPDENGAKVRISKHGNEGYVWYRLLRVDDQKSKSFRIHGPFPTPAAAFADAQRAHEEGKR